MHPLDCPENGIRLVDGSSSTDGCVEVCRNGEWGTICHNFWDARDARVVCRRLGYETDSALGIMDVGGGEGPIHLNYVSCFGTESSLADCQASLNTSQCGHAFDVGVICSHQGV